MLEALDRSSTFESSIKAPLGIQRSLEGINLDPDILGTINFKEDLARIRALQDHWNKALGIKPAGEEAIRSYNPVLARWKYEDWEGQGKKDKFKTHELQQMKTNLRERYRSSESTIYYKVDKEGNVYNELFPNEPIDVILKRGLAYRTENGSPELEREESEIEGWIKIKEYLNNPNTPTGTKATVVSGPGLAEGTTYKDNFVDVYEAIIDHKTGKRMIKLTRHAANTSYDEYYHQLILEDLNYFDGLSGPLDAYLLKNPLLGKEIDFKKGGLKEGQIDEIIRLTLPWCLKYLEALCSEPFDPINTALAFEDILRVGDLIKSGSHKEIQAILSGDIYAAAGFIRRLPIAPVAAGCGLSGGFGLGELGKGGLLGNSVGKFGLLEDEYGSLYFTCPAEDCKKTNVRQHGQLIERCQHCGADVRC